METKILREYLVSLGFKTDTPSLTKFKFTLTGINAGVLKLGASVASMVTGSAAMSHAFAKGMEQMYYKSRLAQATVANLRAVEFGGRQIGLSAETISGSVTALARTLRANPGYQQLLEQLGVKVQGRDMSHVMRDMVAQLRKMPFYVGSQFASMFGMDPDTFLLMSEGLEKYDEAVAERSRLDKEAGFDADRAAKVSVEYANAVDKLTARLGILRDTMAIGLLPTMKNFVGFLDESLQKLDKLLRTPGRLFDGPEAKALATDWKVLGQLFSGDFAGAAKTWKEARDKTGPVVLSPRTQAWVDAQKKGAPGAGAGAPTRPSATGGVSSGTPGSTQALFAGLEAKHGLPPGLLDRMWAKESRRGDPRFMLSPAGAQGHFGFMPGTAKEWGVDPNNLESSAGGAARYMAFLSKRYGGDLNKALAAYNWGLGNVDRLGIGAAPAETRDYMRMSEGLTVHAPTTIIVQGAGDPQAVARSVVQEQNANLARNLGSVVQ